MEKATGQRLSGGSGSRRSGMPGNSEEIALRATQVCLAILQNARTALYLDMRYLDLPLSALSFRINTQLEGIGTDGSVLAAHPKILMDLYERDIRLVNRVYLHEVMHCLLRHPFKKPRRDAQLWDLACDIAAESVIDHLGSRSIRMGVSRLRQNCYRELNESIKVLTAEGVYHVLLGRRHAKVLGDPVLQRLVREFCVDDHSLWPAGQDEPDMPQIEQQRDRWQDISEKTHTKMETFSKEEASGAGDLEQALSAEDRERWDYREFLRKFAVLREEMKVDPDTFDYVFYTFGLSRYGNMPLIEPQEYREVRKIDEFVIVLDVSMSTSGELVQTFLNQTYEVLLEKETYLHKVHIRILQCDEQVRSDQRITSREEMEDYMKHFTLLGGGGTDFRPAFAYVKELTEAGEFRDLRGMLYFTDGYGTYPAKRPPWETAFIFMEEDYSDKGVPPWAIRLVLSREDLEKDEEEDAPFLPGTDYHFISEGEDPH